MKDEFDLLIENRLYNELFGFGGKTQQPQQPSMDPRLAQYLDSQAVPRQQVTQMMQQSLGRIGKILQQGEQSVRTSIKQMASQHNFSTSQKGYPARPQPSALGNGVQQMQNGQLSLASGGTGVGMRKEALELLDVADVFDSLAAEGYEYANELANHAYYTYSLVTEDGQNIAQKIARAGVPQADQSGQAGSAAQTPQAGQAGQAQQMGQKQDDLNKLFVNIKNSVANEFKTLLSFLVQKKVLA